MTATLPLFDIPSAPVADETAALLDLIAGDPLHERDRRVIVRAIVAEAHAHGPVLDPNRLRARLRDEHGLSLVYPRVIGAVIHSLAKAGALEFVGWTESTDSVSGNAGKPAKVWKLLAGDPR